jgi:hypothetical protein
MHAAPVLPAVLLSAASALHRDSPMLHTFHKERDRNTPLELQLQA